jgi:hypothetical protein
MEEAMQSGTTKNGYSAEIERALRQDVLKRLPLTFLPFVNQQLHQWDVLFGNERRAVETLLLYVAGLSPEKARELFAPVIELENRMGVRQWKFSTSEQTIQNSSQLPPRLTFNPGDRRCRRSLTPPNRALKRCRAIPRQAETGWC